MGAFAGRPRGTGIITVALLASQGASAHATTCTGPGIVVFPPPPAVLPSNGVLLIEASGEGVEPISTPAWRPLLVSRPISIALSALSTRKPFADSMQILLRPRRTPAPDRTFRLATGVRFPAPLAELGMSDDERPGFTFSAKADHQPPQWLEAPRFVRMHRDDGYLVRSFGFVIATAVRDDSSVTVAAAIQGPRGGALIHALIDPDGTVFVGNRTCRYRLALDPGAAYTVTLVAIDNAGHATPAPGKPLEVVIPRSATPAPSP